MTICKYELGNASAGILEAAEDKITVEALAFYAGTHTSSDGKTKEYSSERIELIAQNTAAMIQDGARLQVFKDHEYKTDNVVGTITAVRSGPIAAKHITDQRFAELIGRTAIFLELAVSGKDNVERYNDGRISAVSLGIDLTNNYLFEVSVVPFPALGAAALFEQYGLTIEETELQNADYEFFHGLHQKISIFMETIQDIRFADTADKTALNQQAVEDFADRLRKYFGVSEPQFAHIPREPMQDETLDTSPPEQDVSQFADKIALLEAELHQSKVRERFNSLERKAAGLRDSGKLTPNAYNQIFGQPDEAIAKFAQAENTELDAIEYHLGMLEKHGAPVVEFGKHAGDPAPEGEDDETVQARAADMAKNVLKYGGRR